MKSKRALAQELLAPAGITLDGPNPWDPQVHDESIFNRLFNTGSLAIGETYMQGLWDVEDIPELIYRVNRSGVGTNIFKMKSLGLLPHIIRHRLSNRQSRARADLVALKHYDLDNEIYIRMLDPTMAYTCGYWKGAKTLEESQRAKHDLVCRKLGIKEGDRVLDIGCGCGGFAEHAAKHYGASVVGLTISKEQGALAQERVRGLPVEVRLQDYRDVNDGPYDHVVSMGMFEHVGYKNYQQYMQIVRKTLKEDGLFLLHTIGNNRTAWRADPWFDTYIFPNGYLPSPKLIGKAIDGLFVMEDWHTFGADYEQTLLAWFKNFDAAWPGLREEYGGEVFYRMWKYYLLSMAGAFRSRYLNLWQIILSPKGVQGGYKSVR